MRKKCIVMLLIFVLVCTQAGCANNPIPGVSEAVNNAVRQAVGDIRSEKPEAASTADYQEGAIVGDLFGAGAIDNAGDAESRQASGEQGTPDEEESSWAQRHAQLNKNAGEVDFEDMPYEHYDPTEFYDIVELIRDKMQAEKNVGEIEDLMEDLYDEFFRAVTYREIASIQNSIDVTDAYYIEEYSYSSDLVTEMNDAYNVLVRDILASPCGGTIKEEMTEEEIESFESYEDMTAEQNALYSREQELILQYNEAAVSVYEVQYNSRTYETLGNIFLELVEVRQEIARSYGYSDYNEYCYAEVYGRDYSAEEALRLDEQVKRLISPVYTELYDNFFNNNYMSYSKLNRIVAGMDIETQMEKVKSYLSQIDPDMEDCFSFMERNHLYDLEYRTNKMDAGFTTFLYSYGVPFLFNQPGGYFYDLTSLVHEFGHFNSYYVNAESAFYAYDLDLAEIHSQGLEILYTEFYPDMLGGKYGAVATDYILLNLIDSVVAGCLYDEFQQEVYRMENPTLDDINELYTRLAVEYQYAYSWEGINCDWMSVSHNYQNPLYYVSYSISALPALELWEIIQEDGFEAAADIYLELVSYGEVYGYETTLEECGLTSPFTEGYLEELADTIEAYYGLLNAA